MRSSGVALLALAGCVAAACADQPSRPRVLVAASFQTAAERVVGDTAIVVPAASSTLARQIAAGAPSSCFISANREWMDFVEARDELEPGTRRALVRNRLVVVGPKSGAATVSLATFVGKLAMGDPGHVPAGKYGKRALVAVGVWARLARSIVPTANVREALALVERGEVDLAVVYLTDARSSDRVVIVHDFRDDHSGAVPSGPVVEYEIALTRGGDRELLAKLTSAQAMASYLELGFLPARR